MAKVKYCDIHCSEDCNECYCFSCSHCDEYIEIDDKNIKNKTTMKHYTGTKTVKAEPMTMTEAQKVLGRELKPATVEEDGYLVEYKDGYKSWSPKSVFEEAYKCAETFLDRLHIEFTELSNKQDKLEMFFDTDIFEGLPKHKQVLLQAQYGVMLAYSQILVERIRVEEEELSIGAEK